MSARRLLIVATALALGTSALAGDKKKGKAAEPAPAAAPAAEEAPPPGVVVYREAIFSSFGTHMKSMSLIAKGKVDRPARDLAVHAQAIASGAALLPALFPEGTGPDAVKTEALAAIWTDGAGFAAAAEALQAEATKLVELATAGDLDGAKAQLGNVGKACGSCHESFRADDH